MTTPTACPCDNPPLAVLQIPAGLPSLPRQTQTFPDVRRALLASLPSKTALQGWKARGERDFGLMWLEMWAYVSDVLGFYDERIANESYLRTAVLRPSLRRIVDLLGYIPAPGVAATATVAAIAEGKTLVQVPGSTGFRSEAFSGQAPQVFETGEKTAIHVLANSWEIGPVQATILAGADQRNELIFDTASFGLAKDRFVLIRRLDVGDDIAPPQVSKVTRVQPFQGKDGRTYLRVRVNPEVTIASGADLSQVKVQTPTVTAVLTRVGSEPISADKGVTTVDLDAIYRQARVNDRVIVARDIEGALAAPKMILVTEKPIPFNATTGSNTTGSITIPITELQLDQDVTSTSAASSYSFHFSFIDAGRLTQVAETNPTSDLLLSGGLDVVGVIERPPTAGPNGILEQRFLLRDADNEGALVNGRMTFRDDGTAHFDVTDGDLPARLKTPITVFGNVLDTSRGQSVFNEVLGDGDARQANQSFKLKKKPLTYLFDPSVEVTKAKSTLSVRISGSLWTEVRSFFGTGPTDRVYIVRVDDQQNTIVTFGDGVHGARLPSGVKNVIANYRFGSGLAAPPAGALKQLAKAVKGLRRVESPIDARNGRDPDSPSDLRTLAPQSVLLLRRAVSAPDFEVLANLVPGVVKAVAEFLWINEQLGAGIQVSYIGTATQKEVIDALRKEADPTLPLDARPATPVAAGLNLEIEVAGDLDPDVVAKNVKDTLSDPHTGILIAKNAPIGRPLYRSVLFDAIHGVAGVVDIRAANIEIPAQADDTDATRIDFRNAVNASVCAGAGHFFDFADGDRAIVKGFTVTLPVPGAGRQA